MKTDDESEDAEKPPGNNSGNQENSVADVYEENEELQWARRHQPKGRTKQPETRPAGVDAKPQGKPAPKPAPKPAAGPVAGAAFRKTEFRDKPPIFRSEEPVVREKTLIRVMGQDAAIPYTVYEDALRTLTASIVQRQERIAQRLAGEIDELHDRIDILEDKIEMAFDHVRNRLSSLEKERES